jgi:glycosyltransferase involved in cell wall biosynthesis
MDKQLSIIVPVYNVEKYIRPCFESIFRQGLDESIFEVIIVNDGSTDRSMEMIEDIISQHENITVINQENLSLSVARNNGIAAAKGEYILMPDSDDLLIDNSIPPLLEKALETKVDLLVADFLAIRDGEIESFSGVVQDIFTYQEKTGEQLFLDDMDQSQCYVWRTLYRRAFLLDHHISFVPGINYQDIPFTQECYLKAQRCIKTNWLLYIYRTNRPGAATTIFHVQKAKSFIIALAKTRELMHLQHLSPQVRYKLEENIYSAFRTIIYHTTYRINKSSERRQIITMLKDEIPHLCFTHGIKQKLTTFMLQHFPYIYIELYNLYVQIIHRKVLTRTIFHKNSQ